MFFFTTSGLDPQQSDHAFGPLDNQQVRLASRHTGQHLPAYAITHGQLLAMAVDDNHLNLILKPLSVIQHHDLPINYFLYRNVKRNSIVGADDTILRDPASDLLTSIHEAHARRREQVEAIGGVLLPEHPSASALGIGLVEQLPPETTIDDLFLALPDGVAPIMVQAGWQLGHFGDEFAFTIVLGSVFILQGWPIATHLIISFTFRSRLHAQSGISRPRRC